MTAPPATRPLPSCPARHGHGTDIPTAEFAIEHATGATP
jgi:hypothetical protein